MPSKRSAPLKDYQRKRDFKRTAEPKAKTKASATGRLFVVQKHRARQLHYDFRIELDGVLLSWAVPKGPSLDPSSKRLAVQVEDHPVEYGSFEGIIPEDEYGGGTVLVWDRGEWSPLAAAKDSLRKGTLKFTVEGRKLRGAWTLVQMKEKGSPTKNWLLIKERDDEARDEDSFNIIDEEPFSALSGRTVSEIASAKDCVWTARGARGVIHEAVVRWRRGLYRPVDLGAGSLEGAKEVNAPRKFSPLRPQTIDSVPRGDGWIHEILQIGKRALCRLDDDSVLLRSASEEDWTWVLPRIARAAARLPSSSALLDGVVSQSHGGGLELPTIEAADLQYNVFDILFCNGYDLRATPLLERKRLLRKLLEPAEAALAYCDYVEGQGEVVLAEAKRLKAPGIVSKRAASKYSTHKSGDWGVSFLGEEHKSASPAKPRRVRVAIDEPEVTVAGIKLTHPNRVLYPEERVNKRTLAEYYEAIAPRMLPYVEGRPLSLYRCPGGIEKDCFFQKQLGEMSSRHLRGAQSGDDPYVVLQGVRGLVTLAQWNALEIHGWGCREDDLDHPDLVVLDLDPGPDVPWSLIVEGAKGVRLLLEELSLKSFVKTSGGKGLHVVVPLVRRSSWDDVKDFAARVARKIVEVAPKHFTVFMSKPERRGKVFIDYFRNHRGSTCVAPYSTRARPGCFVSTPMRWNELDAAEPPRFHIFKVLDRMDGTEDPWQNFFNCKQRISSKVMTWLRR